MFGNFLYRYRFLFIGLSILLLLFILSKLLPTGSDSIDYNTQIKPILNKKCIHCHGGVKKSGGFSLMTREEALAPTDSEKLAIIPGHPDGSEMIKRILSDDPEERMPLEEEPLSKEETQLLRQWIKEGVKWTKHWAYRPIEKIPVPELSEVALGAVGHVGEKWVSNDIDKFILKRLEENELTPSPIADKKMLIRRVGLDLIGMPAPDSIAQLFYEDNSPQAFEKLVDALLASPRFGERWAAMWLDLARYADTKGYERDPYRPIWTYRDWVIQAFNEDQPYDQFIKEQLAGDLLPNPTDAQYIATGFHRNSTTNDEGGTDNEEFRVAAVLDRVNTTWEVLLGTTFACTQCHGHPYDPFTQKEYYEFMAFFNNSRDEDTNMDYPWLRKFSEEQKEELAALNSWLNEVTTKEHAREISTFLKTWQPAYNSLKADSLVEAAIYDAKYLGLRNNGIARMAQVDLTEKPHLVYRYQSGFDNGTWKIHLDSPEGPVIATIPIKKTNGWEIKEAELVPEEGKHDLYFTYTHPNLPSPKSSGIRFDWFHFTQPFPGKENEAFEEQKNRFWELLTVKLPHTLIMMENPNYMERKSHVFDRGNWLVHQEEVQPNIPETFPAFPEGAAKNRLGLAEWMINTQNPLTARTMVNRIWEQLFGIGLAETLEDLGTQGIPPTHPGLLDYLSWEFMHTYDWSVKRLLKEIVLSSTYQQSSEVQDIHLEKDPLNRWYARMPRVRLSAETIRDQSLVISGLFNPEMYGEPVKPYQPEGVWNSPYNSAKWQQSKEGDQYRRAIYTFWKRSAPYPAAVTFDAVSREVCSARRIRTNTPLQALVTLNDLAFVEMACHLAMRMQEKTDDGAEDPIAVGYELAVGQSINDEKLAVLQELYEASLEEYQHEEDQLKKLLQSWTEEEITPELGALTVVANAIMNLDEFVTKS